MECDQNETCLFGMSTFWNMMKIECDHSKCALFWNVSLLELVLFTMCSFWNVTRQNMLFLECDETRCALFGMGLFWNVIYLEWALLGKYSFGNILFFRMQRKQNKIKIRFAMCTQNTKGTSIKDVRFLGR